MYLAHLAVHTGNRGKSLEAPQSEINKFSHIADPNRRTYAGDFQQSHNAVLLFILEYFNLAPFIYFYLTIITPNWQISHSIYNNIRYNSKIIIST